MEKHRLRSLLVLLLLCSVSLTWAYRKPGKVALTNDAVIEAFCEYIEDGGYYSEAYLQKMRSEVDSHIYVMQHKDERGKEAYVADKQLKGYLTDGKRDIENHRDSIDVFIAGFYDTALNGSTIKDQESCTAQIKSMLDDKLSQRSVVIETLANAVGSEQADTLTSLLGNNSIIIAIIIVVGFILVVVIAVLVLKSKKNNVAVIPENITPAPRQENIIVRRKTTTILKKQSLEDVQDNPAYMEIKCADFCDNSTVRKIYIKNTCVMDIYNMYADDLRSSDNPKENGCMVLGRWVCDTETNEYYVSLEEIVTPGDDAVFAEYELNFGGKIKLKVSEKLRKLRRERNLQYDMTCWVHSHPGLGVFYSNADCGVHSQLKHPTHPGFLIGIVVDILTPTQELGIFTYKHDKSINAKADLLQMYSLEEMYQWAVESDRQSFKAEDHYDVLQHAQKQGASCRGIELSNGAIIDMCNLQMSQRKGLVGWAHGYMVNNFGRMECAINKVADEVSVPDNQLLGCMIIDSHFSMPTIRMHLGDNVKSVMFVLFYSSANDTVTVVPVEDGKLMSDETFFSEVKLEDLKIWTRRKR